MPEWPKGTVCKIVGECLQRFESSSRHRSQLVGALSSDSTDTKRVISVLFR